MRSPNKSRSRNKHNNRKNTSGNVINRVFDSSGPEGRVRGTPQQIIDKYQALASNAQLSGDRVAHENYMQHSEHYARMLSEAQRELAARREHHNQRNQPNGPQPAANNDVDGTDAQPDVVMPSSDPLSGEPAGSDLVNTPEDQPQPDIIPISS